MNTRHIDVFVKFMCDTMARCVPQRGLAQWVYHYTGIVWVWRCIQRKL